MLLLQRNLKVLSDMGLSAKQERTSRFQQIKKEISEMVKVRVPLIKSKVWFQSALMRLHFLCFDSVYWRW